MHILLIVEIISVLFNIVFLVLLIREVKKCWVFGIIGSLLGAYIFFEKLYLSESILYLFYAGLGVYGYIYWDSKADKAFPVKKSSPRAIVLILAGGAATGLALGYLMSHTNADKPYYDAMSTSFGILASFLELYKYLIAWTLWIVINAYSVWLYGEKELNFFAIQMILYTLTSIYGLLLWHKKTNV